MRLKITQKVADLIVSPKQVTELVLAPFDVAPNAIPKSIVDAKGDLIAATAADTVARLPVGTNGQVLVADSAESTGLKYVDNAAGGGEFIAQTGDGTYVPAVGVVAHFRADKNRTIKRVTSLGYGAASGSCVWDIRKDTYANYSNTEPSSGDSICSSSKPTISAAMKAEDSTLSGWTKDITAGDIYRIYLESVGSFTLVALLIEFV